MKSINEDIKTGQFKNIYLLYGEEDYLKRQYRDRLRHAIIPADDTMNYSYFEGKNISETEVIDLAETMPFFAERRLIVIENSGFFKNSVDLMADYMKAVPETTCFVFVENEIDKRGRMYKAVKEKGRIVEMARQDEKSLLMWVGSFMKKEGKKIRTSTANYLLAKAGADMGNLEKEMEKLISYTYGREEVTVEDIDAICVTLLEDKIFAMVEAVATKEQKKALDYYYDLLALKEAPMKILFMLTRQFKKLLEVKVLVNLRYTKQQIAKEAGIHPYAAGKYMQQCGSFTIPRLREILEEAAMHEEMVKTGRIQDILAVELFIVKYSTP